MPNCGQSATRYEQGEGVVTTAVEFPGLGRRWWENRVAAIRNQRVQSGARIRLGTCDTAKANFEISIVVVLASASAIVH